MQIHGPSDEADGSRFAARLNPGTDHPFAVVEMGQVHFFITEPGECDAAIRVWAEAKTLLLAAQHDHDDADLPWTSGAHAFIPCTTCTADACNACSRPAADAVHRIAGDFGAEQVNQP